MSDEDLTRLEKEYLQVRHNGAKAGDPKEEVNRTELEKKRKTFNRIVEQLKQLQVLIDAGTPGL